MKTRIGMIMLLTTIVFNLTISGGEIKRSQGGTSEIVLIGKFETGGLRSGGDVITAEIQDGVILALFHKDVGELLITITNEAGNTVYEATVNTPVQQQLFIPLAGLPSGTYTIAFRNGRGEMWGEFEV